MSVDFSVLIVEDNDDARQNMEDILSLDGYKTKSVSRCLLAISAVESEKFDAIIVDWRLPDENADRLLPIIVKERPHTPVVVVTGIRDFDTAVAALRNGAYDFLLKPINPEVLRAVLGRIVERKRHLEELDRAQAKSLMNERLAAIGQMVAGLAHESRNAFQRSHACLAELALDLEDKPDSLKLVRKVQQALDDLHMLLEEVRDYSAPIILQLRSCCCEALARETWQQILDVRKVEKAPRFEITKSANLPADCLVDCDRIRMVMRNLLENALVACSDPGVVSVDLSFVAGDQPILRITVTDNGKGIAAADVEQVFVPFFTTKTKGTGLGLAVARRYVEAHGGRIFAETSNNGGARFVVELPYRSK